MDLQNKLQFDTRDSQKIAILEFLKQGNSITPLQALDLFKCMRLGGRIFEIKKDGYQIQREMVKVPSGKTVASYRLVNEGQTSSGVAG